MFLLYPTFYTSEKPNFNEDTLSVKKSWFPVTQQGFSPHKEYSIQDHTIMQNN